MWEQVKWAMVESVREVCGSVRGGKNPERVVKQIKTAIRRREVVAFLIHP